MKVIIVFFATAVLSFADAWNGEILPERFEVRHRAKDTFDLPGFGSKNRADSIPSVDSMVVQVHTGAKVEANEKKNDGIEKIHKALSGYFKKSDLDPKNTLFRAKEEYNIRPEIISLGEGNNSLKVELTANSIMKALRDLLSSEQVRMYTDIVARKAAVLYRTVKAEMAKAKARQRPNQRAKSNHGSS